MGVDDTSRLGGHLASGLVTVLAALVSWRRALLGLAVLGCAFWGTWLIYRPAAYLVVAALLLIELATDRPT